ncbi:hypothetical protein LCGC14_0553670 [marine sediment metagenome]|uniref:Uncharacterized protein n=1 Tax=marine sediment metagenome TaxID=412755 RepID=A0A0F9S7T1_9ZZZZ
MKWKYYLQAWDINEPPLPPPNRTIGAFGETRASKRETLEWQVRAEDYGVRLSVS